MSEPHAVMAPIATHIATDNEKSMRVAQARADLYCETNNLRRTTDITVVWGVEPRSTPPTPVMAVTFHAEPV